MTKIQNSKQYDLEERTYQFAQEVALFCKKLPKTITNIEYLKQIIRASGSVGANYIEANESLGSKDFKMRIKVTIRHEGHGEHEVKFDELSNS
ncbi:MAG: four helix bundle protein [bacterium]